MVGASENNPVYSPGVVRSQRAFVQPKQVSSEMASLIRANDGSIDGAKSHIEPKDRWMFMPTISILMINTLYVSM